MNSHALLIAAAILILACGQSNADCCDSSSTPWGDPNPNIFHFCDPTTNSAAQSTCPTDRGFVSNSSIMGCVPFAEWPTSCPIQGLQPTVCAECDLINLFAAPNPNQFYICPVVNEAPVLQNCDSGRGFVSNDIYLGCVPWDQWRESTNCVTY